MRELRTPRFRKTKNSGIHASSYSKPATVLVSIGGSMLLPFNAANARPHGVNASVMKRVVVANRGTMMKHLKDIFVSEGLFEICEC